MKSKHVGSKLDDLLVEDGTLGAATEAALRRVIAWQIIEAMKQQSLSKTEMAKRMKISRAALDRLLDAENPSVTLRSIDKAASVLGKRLRVHLVDAA